jgi:hypothetical protein
VGRLTETQWGWIVTGAIFAWIRTRCEQAISEGFDQEDAVRMTGLSPSPCDAAVVTSILPQLTETAGVDWALPLQAWSKETMTSFLLLAWELITKAEAALGKGKVLGCPSIGTRRGTPSTTSLSTNALRHDVAAAARWGRDQSSALGIEGTVRQHGMRCVSLREEQP